MLVISIDRGGWTHLQTWSRIAMATPVWKSKRRHWTRLDVNTLARHGLLKKGEGFVLTCRVLDRTRQFTLEATNAAFRIDEHGLHGVSGPPSEALPLSIQVYAPEAISDSEERPVTPGTKVPIRRISSSWRATWRHGGARVPNQDAGQRLDQPVGIRWCAVLEGLSSPDPKAPAPSVRRSQITRTRPR